MIWHNAIQESLQRFKDVTADKQNNDSDIFINAMKSLYVVPLSLTCKKASKD